MNEVRLYNIYLITVHSMSMLSVKPSGKIRLFLAVLHLNQPLFISLFKYSIEDHMKGKRVLRCLRERIFSIAFFRSLATAIHHLICVVGSARRRSDSISSKRKSLIKVYD